MKRTNVYTVTILYYGGGGSILENVKAKNKAAAELIALIHYDRVRDQIQHVSSIRSER